MDQTGRRANPRLLPMPSSVSTQTILADEHQADSDGPMLLGGEEEGANGGGVEGRSEEHTSELQSLTTISYAVFCLKKKK